MYISFVMVINFLDSVLECPVLQSPNSGILSTHDHYEGIQVNVTCVSNYTLVGAEISTCHSGKWSATKLGTCMKGK